MDKKIYIKDIIEDKDKLIKLSKEASIDSPHNFHDFEKRISDYINYHVVELDNEVIAMAGMFQSKFWPSDYVRVLDRCYYFKKARSSTLSFYNEKELKATASNYLLPIHLEIAISKHLIPFFSIAGIKRRPAMKRMIDIRNKKNSLKLKVLDKMYFTCNHKVSDNTNEMCWQNIALPEEYDSFDLPTR